MLCGYCKLKDVTGKYGCPKVKKFVRNKSPACTKFVFDTRKVPPDILTTAIDLGKLPQSKVMMLMCLLDSTLRLRAQGLDLGLSLDYEFEYGKNKKRKFKEKVYLVSAPKRSEQAYAVAYQDKRLISVTIDKESFFTERDKKLIKLWEFVETKAMFLKSEKAQKKLIMFYVKRLDTKYLKKTFILCNVPVMSQNKKGIANELLQLFS